ncbi:hypothetical protein [Streptomyces ardesiacus]|uniref:hypothetical protein n=1 Tax=Streptomyces ardesiacus TaxID=285564 RepID=UPI002FDBD020
MTTPWPPRRTARRPLAPRVAAPCEQVDPARIGRSIVRRRAKGMDAGAVAAVLEDARFDARQDSRHEDLADDVRGRAELAEWERLAQLRQGVLRSAAQHSHGPDGTRVLHG